MLNLPKKKRYNGHIFVQCKDPRYASMCGPRNWVLEERFNIADKLGRPLEYWEIVYHINKVTDDNRFENLILFKNKYERDKYLHAERLNNILFSEDKNAKEQTD